MPDSVPTFTSPLALATAVDGPQPGNNEASSPPKKRAPPAPVGAEGAHSALREEGSNSARRARPPPQPQRADIDRLHYYSDLEPVFGIRFSQRHIIRLIKLGQFPAPLQLAGNTTAWTCSMILRWIHERPVGKNFQETPK
jgi:hypothetical protein